jgi:hypothetical protein
MTGINTEYLPTGLHWGLHIERDHRAGNGAGAFIEGGEWKIVHHVTVSPAERVDSMSDVVLENGVSHIVAGFRHGLDLPVVRQMLPFSVAGKSLEHPGGTPETNRAKCIQIEWCAFADGVNAKKSGHPDDWPGAWTDEFYKAVANLCVLIGHRVPVKQVLARSFTNDRRFTPGEFRNVAGHLGHKHVPSQPSGHSDPGDGFKGQHLITLIDCCPVSGYDLEARKLR